MLLFTRNNKAYQWPDDPYLAQKNEAAAGGLEYSWRCATLCSAIWCHKTGARRDWAVDNLAPTKKNLA
jgi:hypothetical protein